MNQLEGKASFSGETLKVSQVLLQAAERVNKELRGAYPPAQANSGETSPRIDSREPVKEPQRAQRASGEENQLRTSPRARECHPGSQSISQVRTFFSTFCPSAGGTRDRRD